MNTQKEVIKGQFIHGYRPYEIEAIKNSLAIKMPAIDIFVKLEDIDGKCLSLRERSIESGRSIDSIYFDYQHGDFIPRFDLPKDKIGGCDEIPQ